MIFVILIVLGIVGMVLTIWISSASLRYIENPAVAHGDEWFITSPEKIESAITLQIQKGFRNLVKVILIWLLAVYRDMSQKVTVKQTLKKKIRAFLYDHTPHGVRHPSEFWHLVRHHETKKPPAPEQISPKEIISGSE